MVGGIQRAMRVVVENGESRDGERLASAGLLIVNPPFGFAEEMLAAGDLLAPRLGHEKTSFAQISVAQVSPWN
jgi:23S rRNA A2030 N6-methylase RlmJ